MDISYRKFFESAGHGSHKRLLVSDFLNKHVCKNRRPHLLKTVQNEESTQYP